MLNAFVTSVEQSKKSGSPVRIRTLNFPIAGLKLLPWPFCRSEETLFKATEILHVLKTIKINRRQKIQAWKTQKDQKFSFILFVDVKFPTN